MLTEDFDEPRLTPVLQNVSMTAVARRDPLIPRLSAKEALILALLRGSEKYGLELVTASDGALKRGTVYVTLGRMEDKGLIVSRVEDATPALGGPPRHGGDSCGGRAWRRRHQRRCRRGYSVGAPAE